MSNFNRATPSASRQYRDQAVNLLLHEANQVAFSLNLPENLPITLSNAFEMYVTPSALVRVGFGNVTTSNYVYYFSAGDKFSSVVRTDSDIIRQKLAKVYLWPTNRLNTNIAYQIATQWLAAASIDVPALTRDCNIFVRAWKPGGEQSSFFVPLYRVYWTPRAGARSGSVAGVELIEPTRMLEQLYVKRPEYILRPALRITNSTSSRASVSARFGSRP